MSRKAVETKVKAAIADICLNAGIEDSREIATLTRRVANELGNKMCLAGYKAHRSRPNSEPNIEKKGNTGKKKERFKVIAKEGNVIVAKKI